MEKKKLLIAICAILVLAMTVAGCSKLIQALSNIKHCDDDAPYYCSEAKACCSYRYTDNHGTCWETMEGCRSSGYACSTCHLEDDDD